MAKGDRWSDDPNVKVREMRNAETVSGVIREREFKAETTGELLEIERLTSSSEGAVTRTRSCGCICYDWLYRQDRTQCATTGTPPRRAAGAIRRCEALGTTYPHPIRVAGLPAREPDDC
jgi:hypothetical protein